MSGTKPPYFLDWAITEKCNLSCQHCRGMRGTELSTETARKLISEIAELKPAWIIIEGGEPLLRENIFELLELMRQRQLEVHLITNGMLLDSQTLIVLKRLGIKVMISIDGATPLTYEAIRNGGSFEKVVQSARQCAKEGLLEAINFTVLKANYTDIPSMFELAASMGKPVMNFIGLKSCEGYSEKVLSPQEYEEAIRLACLAAQETGVEFFFDEPFFKATVSECGLFAQVPLTCAGILVPSTSACIFGDYLFIDTNGEVKPCVFAPLTLGNVNEKSLTEIWSDACSSPFLRQIKEPKNKTGYCRDCRYLEDCMGCRSRTFTLTGDWFASDPCCPLSLELVIKEG